MLKVIESFLESRKGTPDGGEDRLVIVPGYIAVIDGATSKSGEKFDGKTGGTLAADAIAEATRSLPRKANAVDAVKAFTEAVHTNVIEKYLPDLLRPDATGDRPNASVVMYSEDARQIWRIGDGHYGVGSRYSYGKKRVDQLTSELRAGYNHAAIARGIATVESLKTRDIGREIVMTALKEQPMLLNNPDTPLGYGFIDGRPVPEKFVHIKQLDPNAPQVVTLSSDGFLRLKRTLSATVNAQAAYCKEDPLLIGRHKSTKGMSADSKWPDDIAYVRFET